MRGFTHGLGLGTRTLEFIKSLFDQSRVFSSLSLSLFESNFLRFRISQVGAIEREIYPAKTLPFLLHCTPNVGPCGAMQSSNCCFFVEQPCSSSISQSLYRFW
ncbi:Uncharacterized protein Rs2_10152 [Raphanus sativus]|nr:Uncharacterized protein Rs2_10152 [Raphanus sativus]